MSFSQVQDAMFVEDDWNAGHGFHVAAGMRYFIQSNPKLVNALVPRAGILWSNKSGSWTLNGHFGLFSGLQGQSDTAEGAAA